MTPIPITICLFASTKGHFGQRALYLETVDHLAAQVPLSQFAGLFAHIKVTPGDEEYSGTMMAELTKRGFRVETTVADWSHGSTHAPEYVRDLVRVYTNPTIAASQYILHLEDDWQLVPRQGDLLSYISQAIDLLDRFAPVHSVRFPRWENERERINNLPKRHGINAHCVPLNDTFDLSTDFSLNPFIARGQSMYHACVLMSKATNGTPHPEHSLGAAIKFLNVVNETFAHFSPKLVWARHIGTLPGERDPMDKPLYAELS